MYCRGKEKRKEIVQEFNLKPIIHTKLINGKQIHSDAEAKISDEYYRFECTHKTTNQIEYITCGMGAANDLLIQANIKPLILFNPLKDPKDLYNKTHNCQTSNANNNKTILWDDTAKQLYNSIMLLIIIWNDDKPTSTLFKLKEEALKYFYCKPFLNRIKTVNNIISKDVQSRTLSQMIDKLRKNNNIKDYKFDLLEKELINAGLKSYF